MNDKKNIIVKCLNTENVSLIIYDYICFIDNSTFIPFSYLSNYKRKYLSSYKNNYQKYTRDYIICLTNYDFKENQIIEKYAFSSYVYYLSNDYNKQKLLKYIFRKIVHVNVLDWKTTRLNKYITKIKIENKNLVNYLRKLRAKFPNIKHLETSETFSNDMKLTEFKKLETVSIDFNQDIKRDIFPESLKTLVIGQNFNNNIISLPTKLKKLIFSKEKNKSYSDCISELVTWYNKPIETKVLPTTLTYLVLSSEFNQNLPELPPNLIHLHLGKSFNKPINIPESLKCLVLDNYYYSYDIDFVKYKNLEHIHVHRILNYKIFIYCDCEILKLERCCYDPY